MKLIVLVISFTLLSACTTMSQNRQWQLRHTISPERDWWNLLHYDLAVEFIPKDKKIIGSNTIRFEVLKPFQRMQIDLQEPLAISKIVHGESELNYTREGKVYWVDFEKQFTPGETDSITVYYDGLPKESLNPPWSGGITWGHDDLGQDYIVTTAQGIGASIWWPNKDHSYDEPEQGMNIVVTVPEKLTAVANGRLLKTDSKSDGRKTFYWQVLNPINNYGVNVNIGNYINISENYDGLEGKLDINYWVLAHQEQVAREHFKEVPRMLEAFEHWFGPYPFYEDGFKLVSVSYPGMEHQSSVTYGNWFKNGYRGRDVSDTGIGYKFDFIIIHESGHEWFGNNISMNNSADLWIHESFTNYSENLFVEYWFGKEDGHDYVIGSRHNIQNSFPIIDYYNPENSSRDVYYKGGNVLHTLRQIIDNDDLWRSILIGLNKNFRHQTVSTSQIEAYIAEQSGLDLSRFFDQYLRRTNLPEFQYKIKQGDLHYRYVKVVDGFAMPLKVKINDEEVQLRPTTSYQVYESADPITSINVDQNYLVSHIEK